MEGTEADSAPVDSLSGLWGGMLGHRGRENDWLQSAFGDLSVHTHTHTHYTVPLLWIHSSFRMATSLVCDFKIDLLAHYRGLFLRRFSVLDQFLNAFQKSLKGFKKNSKYFRKCIYICIE